MKFHMFMMAASAMVLLQAAPAHAACADDIAAAQAEAGTAILSEGEAQKLEDKLAEARNAAALANESQCENIVADIRNELDSGITLAQLQPDTPDLALNEEEMAMGGTSTDTGQGSAGVQGDADINGGITGDTDSGVTGETSADIGAEAGVDAQGNVPGATAGATGLPDDTTGDADITGDTAAIDDTGADQSAQMNLTVSEVTGVTATNRNGESLGQVESIVRSRDTGEPFVVISSNGFLGMGGDETAVPLSLVDLGTEGATLDLMSRSELETFEDFSEDRFEIVGDETTLSELQIQ